MKLNRKKHKNCVEFSVFLYCFTFVWSKKKRAWNWAVGCQSYIYYFNAKKRRKTERKIWMMKHMSPWIKRKHWRKEGKYKSNIIKKILRLFLWGFWVLIMSVWFYFRSFLLCFPYWHGLLGAKSIFKARMKKEILNWKLLSVCLMIRNKLSFNVYSNGILFDLLHSTKTILVSIIKKYKIK